MPKVRVHNFAISLDGYAAGPDQSLESPLGVGGERLHDWAFATRSGRESHDMEGGETGLDDDFVAERTRNVGATIMGRNMFGPVRGEWGDRSWTGWWGDDPPFSSWSAHRPWPTPASPPRPRTDEPRGPRALDQRSNEQEEQGSWT